MSFLQEFHPQNCEICNQLQAHTICKLCEKIWFDATTYNLNDFKYELNLKRCIKCALILNIDHPWYRQKHDFCHDCDHVAFNFNYSFTLFDYIWPIQHLIPKIKAGHLKLLSHLSQKLAENYLKYQSNHQYKCINTNMDMGVLNLNFADMNIITYVPSSISKVNQRGYNPSHLIAKNIVQFFQKNINAYINSNTYNDKQANTSPKKFKLLNLFDIKQISLQEKMLTQKKLSQEARFLALIDRYQIKKNILSDELYAFFKNEEAKNNPPQKLYIKFFIVDDVMTTGATLDALSHLLKKECLHLKNSLNISNDFNFVIENLVLARAVSFKSSLEKDI